MAVHSKACTGPVIGVDDLTDGPLLEHILSWSVVVFTLADTGIFGENTVLHVGGET